MNQVFSPVRLGMLIDLHWKENRRMYLLSLLAIGGVIAAWYGLLLAMDKYAPLNPMIQYLTYYIGLYLAGCLYASTIFATLGNKAKGILYLSLPASHLEKLGCGILFGVIFFFLAYTALFYLIDIPLVHAANGIIARDHQVWPNNGKPIGSQEVFNLLAENNWAPVPDRTTHLFLAFYFAAQSAFLLGSVYFTRYPFIKTIIALIILWVIAVLFMEKGVAAHLPDGWRPYDFLEWTRPDEYGSQMKWVKLPYGTERMLELFFECIFPPAFWCITYFRLKEKEV